MTRQIRDRLLYNDKSFYIVESSEDGLFEPADYSIQVIPFSTACWRGYHCTYKILDNSPRLEEVYLGLNEQDEESIKQRSRL